MLGRCKGANKTGFNAKGFSHVSRYKSCKVKDGAGFPPYSATGVHLSRGALNAATGDQKICEEGYCFIQQCCCSIMCRHYGGEWSPTKCRHCLFMFKVTVNASGWSRMENFLELCDWKQTVSLWLDSKWGDRACICGGGAPPPHAPPPLVIPPPVT